MTITPAPAAPVAAASVCEGHGHQWGPWHTFTGRTCTHVRSRYCTRCMTWQIVCQCGTKTLPAPF